MIDSGEYKHQTSRHRVNRSLACYYQFFLHIIALLSVNIVKMLWKSAFLLAAQLGRVVGKEQQFLGSDGRSLDEIRDK